MFKSYFTTVVPKLSGCLQLVQRSKELWCPNGKRPRPEIRTDLSSNFREAPISTTTTIDRSGGKRRWRKMEAVEVALIYINRHRINGIVIKYEEDLTGQQQTTKLPTNVTRCHLIARKALTPEAMHGCG
ncbi:hypothetical protein PoB_000119000 [Plakobranchus ocellatus]|uniref:Uncharacterized protein n=1 Tax=Plakobranchus ocellatus TaxID=259542 RepID=A0AAV3XVQ5_9GAST|nr:hypothetical protein PoB_000119000 [Plakobranchus ocellatus]